MNEIEALYAKVYFAKEMGQILKETILIMLKQMIIGGGGTVPDLSNYATHSEMESYVSGQLVSKLDTSTFNTEIIKKANIIDVNASLASKANASDLTNGLATKVDTSTFNTEIVKKANITDMNAALSGKVSTSTFDSQITTINNDLKTKATTTDLSNGLATKVATTTFNSQVTTTNNKITNDIAVSKREIMNDVNIGYLSRAEYADLSVQWFPKDPNGKEPAESQRDFRFWSGKVTTYQSGLWEVDFSEAGFKTPPMVVATAFARNDGKAAGDAAYASIIESSITENGCSGRLSSASSAGLLAAMVSVAADGDIQIMAIGF